MSDKDSPVFVFSAGWRSGSTFLQRLITASGRILVWGEAGGALNSLEDAAQRYAQMLGPGHQQFRHGAGGNGEKQFETFRQDPVQGAHRWVASLNPPATQIDAAFRAFFDTCYGAPARALGFERWGVKEVVSGLETARFLRRLWPDARFLFLVRNPLDCLLSIKRRNWMSLPESRNRPRFFAEHWARLAREFRTADFGHLVRYEDLRQDSDVLQILCDYLDMPLPPADFLASSRADWSPANDAELSFWERRLALRILAREMRAHGYRPR